MISKELKYREHEVFTKLNNYGIGYICDNDGDLKRSFLNNLKQNLYDNGLINYGHKVDTIWYTLKDSYSSETYCSITICDNKYNRKSYNTHSNRSNISEKTLSIILDSIELLIEKREKEIKENQAKISIEELYDNALSYGKFSLINTDYIINIENGKLNYENESDKYNCLVIRQKSNNCYIGSIVLDKNKYGDYSISIRTPLGGTMSYNIKPENYKDEIKYSIKYII